MSKLFGIMSYNSDLNLDSRPINFDVAPSKRKMRKEDLLSFSFPLFFFCSLFFFFLGPVLLSWKEKTKKERKRRAQKNEILKRRRKGKCRGEKGKGEKKKERKKRKDINVEKIVVSWERKN